MAHSARVSYSIDLNDYCAHIFIVTMHIEGASKNQRLSMPTWTPGSYMIREFAQHVMSIEAKDDGRITSVVKTNKNTFEVGNASRDVTVTYRVYGFDSSIRAAFLDDKQAFFNGTALFFRPVGLDVLRYNVALSRPLSNTCASWQVACNMRKVDCDASGFGSYFAENYDELVDHPFQISAMKRLPYVAHGIPHEMVLVGDVASFDEARLTRDLSAMCENQITLFGAAPFSSYLFITRLEDGAYGGLEHRNSSMLLSSPYVLPKNSMKEPDSHYKSFLGLCAHEYFHAWNIKSLKPPELVTIDYDQECYTHMLWIFEGITSYYDDLCIRRAGLISMASYLDILAKNYSRLLKCPGRLLQSVADASFDAWIKFYRPNENSLNAQTSYYLKGSLIGLLLDLSIRLSSTTSLDDVMRKLFAQFGDGKGVSEEDFFGMLADVTGMNVTEFRRDYIYGTKDLPLLPMLQQFGVESTLLGDEHAIDDKTKMNAYLGMKLRIDDHARATVSTVEAYGPAMKAGMSPYDEIIAINGRRLDSPNWTDLLGSLRPLVPAEILFSRRRVIYTCEVVPDEIPQKICKLSVKNELPELERERLQQWAGPV